MTDMSFTQDKQRFAEWRSRRKHREAIPEDLLSRACNHIPTLGITRVARELRLDIRRLRDKAVQAGIVNVKKEHRKTSFPGAVFQEIPLQKVFLPPMPISGLILERPDGLRVRIEGSLPDPEYVGRLAACLVGR